MEVNDKNKIVFAGVSESVVTDGLSENVLVEKTAFTECTRKNGCSDKGTTARVILCAGECAIDVISNLF